MNENSHEATTRLARRLRRRHYRQMASEAHCCGAHACEDHEHEHDAEQGVNAGHGADHAAGKAGQKEIEKLREQLLRHHAEFDNFRKRVRRDQEQQEAQAVMKLVEQLLPVLDNFDRALASPGESVDALLQGLQMVQGQMHQVLEQNGLERIAALGQAFDPNLHEAVTTEPADDGHPANTVTEVFQDGYRLGGRLLRPSMVKVAR